MMKFIRFVYCFVFIIFMEVAIAPSVNAENYSLYSSIDDSNSICDLLIDLYQNSPAYDPFNEYAVCRVDQYDYRLFYGPNLENGALYYKYEPAYGVGGVVRISTGSVSSVHVSTNGYTYVGNVSGSSASFKADQYRFYKVSIVVFILISIVLLFKFFRFRVSVSKRSGYTM